jgi:hypothetical protein
MSGVRPTRSRGLFLVVREEASLVSLSRPKLAGDKIWVRGRTFQSLAANTRYGTKQLKGDGDNSELNPLVEWKYHCRERIVG